MIPNREQPGRKDLVEDIVTQQPHPMTPVIPVSAPLLKAADAAWSAYASCCRWGGAPAERALSYAAARLAEQRVWQAAGFAAARTTPGGPQ